MGLFGNKDLEYDVITIKKEIKKLRESVWSLCPHKQVELIESSSKGFLFTRYRCLVCNKIFLDKPKKSKLVKMKYCEVD